LFKNSEIAVGSSSKNIDKAEQKLAQMNMNQEEKKRYDKYLTNLAKDRDVVNTAIEEGVNIGENKKAIEMAKEMIIENLPKEQIARISKLPLEIIEQLINELKAEGK